MKFKWFRTLLLGQTVSQKMLTNLSWCQIWKFLFDKKGFGECRVKCSGNAASLSGLIKEGDFDPIDDHRWLSRRRATLVVRVVSVELFEGLKITLQRFQTYLSRAQNHWIMGFRLLKFLSGLLCERPVFEWRLSQRCDCSESEWCTNTKRW